MFSTNFFIKFCRIRFYLYLFQEGMTKAILLLIT